MCAPARLTRSAQMSCSCSYQRGTESMRNLTMMKKSSPSPSVASLWRFLQVLMLMVVLQFAVEPATAAEKQGGSAAFQNLDKRIQDTKQEVLELNRDLFVLEEEILFPASTQVAVFF